MMELVLVILITSLSNIACVLLGAKLFGRANTGEVKSIPNPVEFIKSRKESNEIQKEYEQQQEEFKTMMHNIDVYDGTSAGQKEVG